MEKLQNLNKDFMLKLAESYTTEKSIFYEWLTRYKEVNGFDLMFQIKSYPFVGLPFEFQQGILLRFKKHIMGNKALAPVNTPEELKVFIKLLFQIMYETAEIKVGDKVTLSPLKGYTFSQRSEVMEVIEVVGEVVTAKFSCDTKCLTKKRTHFRRFRVIEKENGNTKKS